MNVSATTLPHLPPDFDEAATQAWECAATTPGFMGEKELRALLMLAAVADRPGALVEIGSYKGRSTLGLAKLAARYGWEAVVSIDPHNSPSATDPGGTSYEAFMGGLEGAGLHDHVEVHRATSREVAVGWQRPIRMLWIDGDHTHAGALEDFRLFAPFLSDGALVAFHDTLHFFEGPIRVMVENLLRSDDFGAAGFLHTIGWAQYVPGAGARFRGPRGQLARRAARLLPLVAPPRENRGWDKLRFKLALAQVPHGVPAPEAWLAQSGLIGAADASQ